jgi:hypothetical protein
MAKNKKYDSEDGSYDSGLDGDGEEVAAEPVRAPVVVHTHKAKKSAVRVKATKEKRMDFDHYARRKGVKTTHVPGMRAFAKNPRIPRTYEEWDAYFAKY